jgi:hypothetical protein
MSPTLKTRPSSEELSMPRRRVGRHEIKAPPGRLTSTVVFRGDDVQSLADKAGLPIQEGIDTDAVAIAMNWALLNAHYAELRTQNTPGPGSMRDAFDGVASKGRELLLALGLDGEPADIATLDRSGVGKASSVLGALIHRSDAAPVTFLATDVVEIYIGTGEPNEETLRVAANRYAVEAARAVAFLVAFAESARPQGSRSGPPRNAFTPCFLEALARVYRDTFGRWPVMRRTVTGERDGPSLLWLGEILRLSVERISRCRVTEKDALISALDSIMKNEPETQGSDFEKAATRARHAEAVP